MKALIIGGGIGGLSAALSLQKIGIEYDVFEQAPAFTEVGAGIVLSHHAAEMLAQLGVATDSGLSLRFIALSDAQFKPFRKPILSQNVVSRTFHRATLINILKAPLEASRIHLNKTLSKVEMLENGVTAHFTDGTTAQGDFLIATDGIHSVARQQLFPQAQMRYSGQTAWRGVAHFSVEAPFDEASFEAWGNRVRFGVVPINADETGNPRVYWFAVAKRTAGEKDDPQTLRHDLKMLFQDFASPVSALIEATPTILRNDLYDLNPKSMPKWYEKRVLLMGDAAHATTPNLGQGGCQAIEDAFALGKCLTKYASDVQMAFSHFQTLRQSKVHWIVNQSRQIGQMAHSNALIRSFVQYGMTFSPESVLRRTFDRINDLSYLQHLD